MAIHRFVFLSVIAASLARFAAGGEDIPNWSAPASWSPPRSHAVSILSEAPPLPFIAITPCRVADTRGNGFTGPYGPPSLVANATRSFAITGQCGIPAGAAAVSFNFGALNVGGGGDLRVFPAGGGVPLVSTMNYNASTPNIANAAIVPLSNGGAITVQADAVSIDLIIDVNGYYSSTLGTPQNFFRIDNNSTSFSIWSTNSSTTCAGACGILADIASFSGAAAIWGEATATTGAGVGVRGRSFSTSPSTYGVFGTTSSSNQDAAGVRGQDGTGVPAGTIGQPSSGVRGDSKNSLGVFGTSQAVAVRGIRVDSGGSLVADGLLGYAVSTTGYGVWSQLGDIGCASCMKSFVDPHPNDPSKSIRYVALEGNEAGTYFRGTARTVNGEAVIEVPEDFRMVTDEEGLTVQLTPVGKLATLAVTEENLRQIMVRSSQDVAFHYRVQGIRPAFTDFRPIQEGNGFVPLSANERMPSWPEWTRKRLIANGTYNEDGTINRDTARRLGWDKVREKRSEAASVRPTSAVDGRPASGTEAIPGWFAPATWSPPRSHGVTTLSEAPPLPFIAITPCRVADTRGNGFTGPYGPPSLVANATRSFTITGQCGIPAGAAAVSFNFGALNVGGGGDLRVFPAGGGVPLVSTMNYNASTPNIANAAIVPLSNGGAITVQADAVSIDLIIDVNGYYSSTLGTPQNFFRIDNNSTSFSIWSTNSSTTCAGACGILADIASFSGAAAIWGEATATTGAGVGVRGRSFSTSPSTYGVFGTTSSSNQDAAGVRGQDGTGVPAGTIGQPSSGVRGDSKNSLGVFGTSQVVGVRGIRVDSGGTEIALGSLGQTFFDVPYGVFSTIGDIGCASCMKSFVDPHPTDPSKSIRYVALEGNEAGTYFRGTGHTVDGEAVIEVPEDFRMVTDEEGLTVQLTPVGKLATLAVTEENLQRIVVRSSQDVTFHYLVQGVRPAFKDFRPIQEGNGFVPLTADGKMPNWPEWTRKRLIVNGTYNEDGTINRDTARRLGWDKVWEERTRTAPAP